MIQTAPSRRLEYLPIDELVPAESNPKEHDDAGIAASMIEFGFTEPLLLDERTGRLVVGHGRWENLLALAAAKPDDPPEGIMVIDGRWHVPVIRGWASRDDDHAEAYLLASNELTIKAGWNGPALVDMLGRVDNAGLLEVAGFDPHRLEDLLATLGPPPNLDDLADQFGEPDPSHLWPVLRFRVPPAVRDRYLRLVEGLAGGDDVLFAHLIELAERP